MPGRKWTKNHLALMERRRFRGTVLATQDAKKEILAKTEIPGNTKVRQRGTGCLVADTD